MISVLLRINSWLDMAKEAAKRGDTSMAWSSCNQAQHIINDELRKAEEALPKQSDDPKEKP